MTIVDRKKELIINSAGKNMSPANIEQTLKAADALIGQAVCIGDRRPYNVALLVLDPDAVAAGAAAPTTPRRWRDGGRGRRRPRADEANARRASSRSSATCSWTPTGCPAATS